MGLIVMALAVIVSVALLVVSLVRQQRYVLRLAIVVNVLVILGAVLTLASVALALLWGGGDLPVRLIGVLLSVLGFVLALVSPRSDRPPRAFGAPGTAPYVASVPVAPAGWFPAADRPGELRWWDGTAWTEHYHRPE